MNILLVALSTLGYVFDTMLIGAGFFMLCDGCIEFVNICFMFSCTFCRHTKAHGASPPSG